MAKALRGQPISDQPALPTDRTPPNVGLNIEEMVPQSVTVKVTATPGSPTAGIVGIRVTVDGRDIAPQRGAGIVRKRIADGKVAFLATVDFPPGKQDALVAAYGHGRSWPAKRSGSIVGATTSQGAARV